MKQRPLMSQLLLFLTVTAFGCGGMADDKPSVAELIPSTCAKVKSLNCPADASITKATCEQILNHFESQNPTCSAKLQDFLICLNDAPASSLECAPNQAFNVPEGTCTTEKAAYQSCVDAD